MDFPFQRFHRPVICPESPEAIGIAIRAVGLQGTASSGAWPAANRAIFVPFCLAAPYPMTKVWWANGTTANANIDCGVYTIGGTLLGAIGSTAQAGTSVVQSAALPLYLTPGAYYMALLLSATSGTIQRKSLNILSSQVVGMAQQAVGATALPATATLATTASTYLPQFGIASAGVI